ncbi:MAG: hypothetical protein ABIW94_12955 [Gemmatimonadaceae bacterium]
MKEKFLGTGHPNLILQRDFADIDGWVATVETTVPIEDSKRQQIEEWLALPRSKALADYLVGRVPADTRSDRAKHMIAAAFGFEWDGSAVIEPASTPTPTPRQS